MTLPIGDGYASVGPCGEHIAVSTNATQTYDPPTRAVYFSVAGTFQYQPLWTATSATVTVVAGGWLPVRLKYSYAAPAGTIAFW